MTNFFVRCWEHRFGLQCHSQDTAALFSVPSVWYYIYFTWTWWHTPQTLITILLLLWFIMVECAIYLYSYKATRTMKTNYNNIWRVNLVPSSLRVALPPSPTHTHTVKWKRVFPCFRFTLGSRIRLHVGSPRGTSERIGRREEACGTMWERDFWRAIAYLLYVKCDQEILGRVNQRAALL